MDQRPETVTQIDDAVIRIIAPNLSPMTYWGTNSFLLGTGRKRVLIDPGPKSEKHLDAVMNALPQDVEISHILITHSHLDHSAGTPTFVAATGAKTYGFGGATAGRSARMNALVAQDNVEGGEGVDWRFEPDILLSHGDVLDTPAGDILALHTPGHMGNHLSFAYRDMCFCGDIIMGWSSSLISPPDGDAEQFRNSLALIAHHRFSTLLPAHGAQIDAPSQRIEELLEHRAQREAEILEALTGPPQSLSALTQQVYPDLPAFAQSYAARNTFAHLIDLFDQKRITAQPTLSEGSLFSRKTGKA